MRAIVCCHQRRELGDLLVVSRRSDKWRVDRRLHNDAIAGLARTFTKIYRDKELAIDK